MKTKQIMLSQQIKVCLQVLNIGSNLADLNNHFDEEYEDKVLDNSTII